ncbi:MAG TPA: GH92 family glycosyl hydrolase [Clostridiales bacterium]|nr:GH92 family glycosyl hydrolase [Clostridiales bacterium]
MLATIKKLQSLLLTLVIFLSAVFTTGAPPASVTMPDLKAGVYGRWVNPFIGTGGYPWVCAMLFPGAATPFGMVRLSPDTILPGGADFVNLGFAGYYYPYRHLRGFSHTRLVGAGTGDMGHFRVTPAIGNTKPADRLTHPLVFTHEQEEATAGYYAVNLPGIDCMAELTATTHAGVHRYTFRSEKDAHLFIDATSFRTAGSAADGKVRILPDAMEIEEEGLIHSNGGLKGYFVARFSKPFKSCATWTNGVSAAGSTEAAGDDTGADINFGNIKNEPVELKLGISFVSLENARLNLDAETGGLDFEGVRDAARDTWDTALSKIKIESPDREMKTIFYTALYHSMMMPTDFTDVNGQYLGFKEQAGTAEGFTYRTDMALWDTFRTLHPLLNLIAPDTQRDCLKSLVLMARANGSLPRWASESRDTGSMFGTPANMVIAESYLKGITDFEAVEAYAFMKNTALETGAHPESHPDIQALNRYGYVPADLENISVSKTLELSWAAGSIALLADALGNTEDAALFTGKSMSYKNIFNPATKYFQGRNADGSWQQPFLPNILSYYDEILPIKVSTAYCEGSPRQWRWTAPQDTAGLIALFGSREYFVRELNQFMADASKNLSAVVPGSGFWMGNEHDMHAPYLFDDAGRPDLTQKWARWALAERFSTAVNGLDGNDDGGTLSAWYVFSAMGLYPVAGTDRYWIGSPNVNKAVIDLGTGKTLTVKAENQSAENIYVQSVTLNGVRLTEPSIVHAQIAGGGTMTFVMGPAPAVNGGF